MKRCQKLTMIILMFVVSLMPSMGANAASYPVATARNVYASVGETAYIVYMYLPSYNNERLTVDLYDSSNRKIASAKRDFSNKYASSIQYYTVQWDTRGKAAGTYKAVVTKEFYSMYRWNTAPTTSTSYIYLVDDLQGVNGNNKYTGTDNEFTCTQNGTQNAINNSICSSLSAWKNTVFTNYEIQLKELLLGDNAQSIVKEENMYNATAPDGMQWYLMKFDITNNSSTTLAASDIISQTEFYKYTGAKMSVATSAVVDEDKDVDDVKIAPGTTEEVWIGICAPICQQMPYLKVSNTYLNINPLYADSVNDSTHNIVKDEAVSATCTKDGLSEGQHCSLCNTTIKEQTVIKSTGHKWDNGKVSIKATKKTEGKKIYTCTSCGETKVEIIPKLTEDNDNSLVSGTPSTIDVGSTALISSGKYKVTQLNGWIKEVTYLAPASSRKVSVTIPETVMINGDIYKVTAISDKAFKNNKKLKKIIIGKNVRKIGKNAFYGCKNIKKMTIKSTILTSVGKNAIKGINKKATIKVPKKKFKQYKKLFKSKTGYKNTMKIKK